MASETGTIPTGRSGWPMSKRARPSSSRLANITAVLLIWSPDSKTLAFIADTRDDRDIDPGKPEIWTIPAMGGELTRIPAPEAPKYGLSWSPDGQTFAYVGVPD